MASIVGAELGVQFSVCSVFPFDGRCPQTVSKSKSSTTGFGDIFWGVLGISLMYICFLIHMYIYIYIYKKNGVMADHNIRIRRICGRSKTFR